MLWFRAFHVIFMVTWFAGLFYLPRLFVYHAAATDEISRVRFVIMERKLFFGIMTPGAILTIIFGVLLYSHNVSYYWHATWMQIKLLALLALLIFHGYCGYYWWQFKQNCNKHTESFYRWFNEIPTVLLFIIIIMVIAQPL